MKLKVIIGNNLKYYRYKSGKSQEKFYSELGLNYKYYAGIERGVNNISADYIDILADKLGIDSSNLVNYRAERIINKKRIDELDKRKKETLMNS